ncbi:MAG: glycosyltransferase family 4 protein [Prochloraceae cyanobacterium]|nr:glycosyltransferase family 4 protein [Prochloraceae cyanobacterium]
MKPKIWHLIGDKRAGGSNLLVKQLIDSRLKEQFDFSVFRLEEVKQEFKKIQPDAIVFHYPCAWKYLYDLIEFKQQTQVYIYDHHYCEYFEKNQVKSTFRFRLMLRIAYGIADGVLSVSQGQKKWLLKNKLVSPDKIQVITPASTIEAMLNIAPKNQKSPLILGAFGRFAPQKGFDLLLEAFQLLPAEKYQLYLGGYGQDEAQIKQLAKDLVNVKLLGKISDVPEFLASCDAIIIPSRWEPWGLVCLEAKAAAKPVVANAVDGLCEQIQPAWGILVPPNDKQKLAAAIASLDHIDLLEFGKAGRSSVVKANQEFIHNWANFLNEITKNA